MRDAEGFLADDAQRPTFVVTRSGTVKWSPNIGDLITDTSCDRVGRAVGWDGDVVSIAPLDGGEPWHTTTYRPANAKDRLRARATVINRERRGRPW
ncbi:hypothetical protein [Streptomyces sp. NPDC053048]|uniref:hypothetical protein n=1 Tax=Streptomyces sp. NPDC053048 TaxID=3365694 RepID=UPI0037CF0B70